MNEKEHEEKRMLSMLAAFVDGEGTIGIVRHMPSSGNYTYDQRLTVANTDIRLINWLVENFGGEFPEAKKDKRGNCKDSYTWYLGSSSSYKLIKRMRPYLLLKQEQADCAIELWEKVTNRVDNNRPLTGWKKQLADELWQECAILNNVGGDGNDDKIEVLVPIKIRKEDLDIWIGIGEETK